MRLNYLTTNQFKFEIAQQYFHTVSGYELVQHSFHVPEVQEATCEKVAEQSAIYAARELKEPCIVMDVGFSIAALNGFPGPFVKYINDWLSEEQLLQMLDEADDRRAHFIDVLAVGFSDGTAKTFSHTTEGRLAKEGEYERTKWPVNSLFIPAGYSMPLGPMSDQLQKDFGLVRVKTGSI